MANFYVDFSAGTNGTGTAASPWNVFTATQNASVSAGDSVWFRRYLMTYDTKLMTWKGGTDTNNRINYIGWPLPGDTNYDSREPTLQAKWDADPAKYAYQIKRAYTANTPTTLLPSNVNLYRFYIWEDYTAANYIRNALSTKTYSNIRVENCYMYNTYNPTNTITDWFGGALYCEDSYNIEIVNSDIDGGGIGSIKFSTTLKIKNSTVSFNGCRLYYGYLTGGTPAIAGINDIISSYCVSSTLNFTNCDFYFRQSSSNIGSTYSTSTFYGEQHFINCNTTISGCTMTIGSNQYTPPLSYLMPINIPISIFRISGGTFDVLDSSGSLAFAKFTIFELMEGVDFTINGFDWHIDTGYFSNIFILIRNTIGSIHLSNITGDVPINGTGDFGTENFFIGFIGWGNVDSSNDITFTNVNTGLGYVLDASRFDGSYNTLVRITDNNCPAVQYGTIYVSAVTSLEALNSIIGGIKYMYNTYASGSFVQGANIVGVSVKMFGCTLTDVPIQTTSTNTQFIYAKIGNCVGAGTDLVNLNSNTIGGIDLVASRNNGFTGIGTLPDVPTARASALLNDFNSGTAMYMSYDLTYETSIASRNGGAGYAVKIIKKLDDNIPVYYPNIGEDATWVYFPIADDYSVTAYVYYTATSGSLTTDDIQLGIDIMGAYSYEDKTSVMSSDNSVWTGVGTGTKIKLVSTITIPKEQYAPVRLYLNLKLPGLIVYFDPKLDVVVV